MKTVLIKKNLELIFYCSHSNKTSLPLLSIKLLFRLEEEFQYLQEKQTEVLEVCKEIPLKYSNLTFSVCVLPLSEPEGQNHLLTWRLELPGAQCVCLCSCRFRHEGAVQQQHRVSWGCCLVSELCPTRSDGVGSPSREPETLDASLELHR